jgi:HlyD family secretion protein
MLKAVNVLLLVGVLILSSSADARPVSSLGRIEPLNGVIRLAGPSELAVVSDLRVREGDRVERGQILATLDTHDVLVAEVDRAKAALDHAGRVLERNSALQQNAFQSRAAIDEAERDVALRRAELVAATAQLARASVRAPIAGQVLAIHARQGERIGQNGLLELGQTERMYVVAEVYETDIGQVRVGQTAVAHSPALATPVTGKVDRVGLLVARNDALGLDPVARTDSRVVEVFVLLDDPAAVAGLTNLQVTVEIGD